MSTIIIGSWMFRYPLGGNISWCLQYLVGFRNLGHDVFFVEKFGYPDSCYDPGKEVMGNDCSYGIKVVADLLKRFGFEEKWCFVEYGDVYHGLSRQKINEVFQRADLFIDMGSHGSWQEESSRTKLKVLIDGEPGYTQIKMSNRLENGETLPEYDRYFTFGKNIGTIGNPIPTIGINWEYIYNPVVTSLFALSTPSANAPYSTIMNWKAHEIVKFRDEVFGQKDIEFPKFIDLPKLARVPMEVAVSGKNIPLNKLEENGWMVKPGKEVTRTYDSFLRYISWCRGEFSVCKNVFVANDSGWFSDRSAAYLASGRPVVMQDTGFSKHLPVGEGLFAVNTKVEALEAFEKIEENYTKHSRRAREIACDCLEAEKVFKKFLNELGI